MNEFTVNAKLPSLNEYIAACNSNRYQGGSFKKEIEEVICWAIRQAQAKGTLHPIEKPCKVLFVWNERTYKRDCDNIASAKKYILDAMQKCRIIPNDNQQYIKGFTDEFYKADRDFVIVRLEECEI